MDGYKALEARILAWAAGRADLLAGVVVGSRARPDGTADQWSDLDLILFTDSPQIYLGRSSWLDEFGDMWATSLSRTGSGYPEWFALYAGGLKVDIVFVPVQVAERHGLPQMLADFAFQDVLQHGLRVLFDKTSTADVEPYLPAPAAPLALPSQDEFQEAEAHFWIVAAKAARLAKRNDLWRAKQACDSELKACLLTMLEWHARAIYGPDRISGMKVASWQTGPRPGLYQHCPVLLPPTTRPTSGGRCWRRWRYTAGWQMRSQLS
jgi:hypothetical protein